MTHTKQCSQRQEAHKASLTEYLEAWPDYCRTCNGAGQFETHDSVDYGSTTVDLPGQEPCEECSGKGVCPRCGKEIPEDHEFWMVGDPCPHCEFAWGREAGDLLPEYECDCWPTEEVAYWDHD